MRASQSGPRGAAPVRVVAHRGASGTHPENTAAALRRAAELDVEMIELDVRLTADGRTVVIHDDRVDRTSDGHGEVAHMRLAEIQALDAGSWFAPAFAGERFLTLEEALDVVPAGPRLNVHVKALAETRERLVSLVVGELARRALVPTAFVASDEQTLDLARRLRPGLAVCNLSIEPGATYVERSRRTGCTILQPPNALTTPALVAAAHALGMEVNPFYADDEAEMLRLTRCGVDGILTNYPERLQALCRRQEEGPVPPPDSGARTCAQGG